MHHDRIDDLITELAKPIYVYRMAQGNSKSAQTRKNNAKREIDRIVNNYVAHSTFTLN